MTNEPKSPRSVDQPESPDRNPTNFSSKQPSVLQKILEETFTLLHGKTACQVTDDPGTDSEYLTLWDGKETSLNLYAGSYPGSTLPQLILETDNGPVVFLLTYCQELTEIEATNRGFSTEIPKNETDELLQHLSDLELRVQDDTDRICKAAQDLLNKLNGFTRLQEVQQRAPTWARVIDKSVENLKKVLGKIANTGKQPLQSNQQTPSNRS